MHAITVWQDPEELKARNPRGRRRLHRLRHRPQEHDPVQPEPGARARRAGLDLQLRGPPRLAQPHDPVQGEGRQGPRERLRRPLRLSRADGRRHPGLSRHPRAGGRRPEAAPGAEPATSRRSSTTTLRPDPRAGFATHLLPAARAGDHGAGHARHEPARRHQEDVEIRALGHVAHQHDRRCRHHRQEDPEGQDRPRSRCPRRGRARKRPEADNLVGIYAALAGKTKAEVLAEFGGAQFSTFKRRWPSWRSRASRRSTPR